MHEAVSTRLLTYSSIYISNNQKSVSINISLKGTFDHRVVILNHYLAKNWTALGN